MADFQLASSVRVLPGRNSLVGVPPQSPRTALRAGCAFLKNAFLSTFCKTEFIISQKWNPYNLTYFRLTASCAPAIGACVDLKSR